MGQEFIYLLSFRCVALLYALFAIRPACVIQFLWKTIRVFIAKIKVVVPYVI